MARHDHDPTYGFYGDNPSSPSPSTEADVPDGRHFHYYKMPRVGAKVLEAVAEPEGASEAIEQALQTQRQQLLERYASDLKGLNIERMNGFLDDLGVRRSALLVLDKAQKPDLIQFLAETTGTAPATADVNNHGWYAADLDVAVVLRDEGLEQLNGPEYTESIIVHELAHSSASGRDMSVFVGQQNDSLSLDVTQPRQGQTVQRLHSVDGQDAHAGRFLEEGFAEQVRAIYITNVLNLPHGFAKLPDDALRSYGNDGRLEFSVPSKYAYFSNADNREQVNVTTTSSAGAALDELIAIDPQLFPAMIKARGDVDGLREVAQRIDAIHPGLYRTLRDDFNVDSLFQDGLSYVFATVRHENTGDQADR